MRLEPVTQGQIQTRLPTLARSLEFGQNVRREANGDPLLGCLRSRAAAHRSQLPELCGRQLIGITIVGNTGVDIFFVISGFVMAVTAGRAGYPALRFLERQILRFVPLYWSMTVLTALLLLVAPDLFRDTTRTSPSWRPGGAASVLPI